MKKIFSMGLFLLMAFVTKAQLMYEPFNYTPHATEGLSAQSGGLWQKVNTGDSILVTSGNLNYAGLASSTGNKVSFAGAGTDYFRSFTAQTSGTVYYSFILNTTSLGSLDATGGYFIGIIQTASTSNFGAVVWTRASTAPGKYNIGIATRSNSTVSWLPNELDPATNYFVVAAYEIISGTANDVAKLWLNTTAIGGSEPAADVTAAPGTDISATGIERVLLRQDSDPETAPVDIDEIRVGTTWTSVTPSGAATPTLTISSPLTAFGNVCINTTAGPNPFTISGSNLTTADVTVAALTGFTYSTTAGGTYTNTLTLTQPGGTFSQQVFVKFDPTVVQTYNGNIAVAGGGFTGPVNAAASGAGVNTTPTVVTGTPATSITQNSATAPGTISANGCSSITAYGIEYSTTTGFVNGTGTQVASTNLSGGNFSSNLIGLIAATPYYYKAYATNAGGTVWGTEQTFTTLAAIPPSINVTPLTAFGNICINTTAGPNSFTISGSNLTIADVTVAALAGYTYSTTAGGTYTTTLSIPQTGGTFSQEVFVKFDPTVVQSYGGNIVVAGGGVALPVNVEASGTGVNTTPTVTTGAPATSITENSATAPGSINATGCTSITAYGIEYSTTTGFVNGTGTQVASTNLSAGIFSSNLTGLVAATPYYYKAFATNAGGTVWGDEQTFTTLAAVPALNATALAAFGNVCINTTAGPNSFTISGSNLSNAEITVAALSGFTYSTTAGGTYTSSLTLIQPGGIFSQEIFVKFDPTVVQSYNGNIVVSGGGVSLPVNVAASGAGVNSLPSVTTGSASAITEISATAAGSISNDGCTSVTAYGIEYSTTSGFVNGTGTQVASSNLSGGNFSSNLTGLVAATPYYYKAFATNAAGTAYGIEQTFTTISPNPSITTSTLTAFGNVCINTTAGPNSFSITGTNLTNADVIVGPLAGFSFSTTAGGTYTASLTLSQPGGSYSQQVFVTFSPTAVQSYSGNIPVSGGGIPTTVNVAASGDGVNTTPSVTTGSASAITATTATLGGSITSTGCTAISAYGIEYSTVNNFVNGTGTPVASTNLSGGNFTSGLSGLIPSTTYYYKAYAINSGGTVYGEQQSFITATPAVIVSSLSVFGNVCINTTAGPNSFTITGTNLNSTDVIVGPLPGFSFSTTAGGTYTASLTLAQPGGSYSQQVFVTFTPTAVQSYSGIIPVSGGGIPSIVNVAASGDGVNTTPSVTTGAASAITAITATAGGSITATGCSAISAYGIEYSTVNNFVNGSGIQVASTNISGGNFTSGLSGLIPSTTYYYKAYATNAGGTVYGVQQSFITATPVFTVTALSAFGSVCINTTAGPNSFTITGTNLTTANVNVGPLPGFTFATNTGGTYTASLNLTQTGGAYSQQIFVKFNPTAVQSYNGNIPVGGGGATTVNVAASGSGVNTAPSVTTGVSSAVTQNTATAAGSITATGCTSVTVYGIEYSTTNNFVNGTGIQVASTNLSGGNYTSGLTGLVPSTTYYYKAYATNAGGTTYGNQQSFTTAVPVLSTTALTAFGSVCINNTAGPNSFTITGVGLTSVNISVGPLNGYSFSTTSGGTYSATLSLTQSGGAYSQAVFVKFLPVAVQSYNGNIPVSGGGAVAINVAASGDGVNTMATVISGLSANLTNHSVVLAGSLASVGCSPVTSYGIEYSGINGFTNGTGTKVVSTNLASGNFTTFLDGLVQGATYYYKAYAVNNGGTSYGLQQSFTVIPIGQGFKLYPMPVVSGSEIRITMDKNITPGYYGMLIFNSDGQLVYQKDMNIQANFINQTFRLPAALGRGIYIAYLVNYKETIATRNIFIQ